MESLNLNEATVWIIKKNEKEIRSAGSSTSVKYAAPWMLIIKKMEKAFSNWIDDSCQKRILLDGI